LPALRGFMTSVLVTKSTTAAATASGSLSASARLGGGVRISSWGRPSLTAQPTDRLHTARHVSPRVGGIRFTDVGERLCISEDRQRLLEGIQVVGTDQDCCRAPVPRDHDALVLVLHPVDIFVAARILAEVVDVRRYPTRHTFAAANGSAPISASSGRTVRHRLNRGGN
jgi:hypothetical protein